MNLKPIVSVTGSLQKRLTGLVLAAVLLVTPLLSICQITPPPPDVEGGSPDVPFDNNMNLIFLAAGILFAVIITVKQLRKRAATTA
jgi:hypothetical protein